MIDAKIEKYDVKQDQRQRETSIKLDRNEDATNSLRESFASEFKEIRKTLADQNIANGATTGVNAYKAYIIPILLSAATIVVLILELLKKG